MLLTFLKSFIIIVKAMLLNIVNAKSRQEQNIDFSCEVKLSDDCIASKNYKFLSPAKVNGYMCYKNEQLRVVASVSVSMLVVCDTCGTEFEKKLEFDFDETFVESSNEVGDEKYVMNQTCVELDKPIEDNFLLNLPTKIVCKKNCKGLCPICGKNKNLYDCDCESIYSDKDDDNPFKKLNNK